MHQPYGECLLPACHVPRSGTSTLLALLSVTERSRLEEQPCARGLPGSDGVTWAPGCPVLQPLTPALHCAQRAFDTLERRERFIFSHFVLLLPEHWS